MRKLLVDEGYKVRKFGRFGVLRITENKARGLCIATHPLIKDKLYVIQVI